MKMLENVIQFTNKPFESGYKRHTDNNKSSTNKTEKVYSEFANLIEFISYLRKFTTF